ARCRCGTGFISTGVNVPPGRASGAGGVFVAGADDPPAGGVADCWVGAAGGAGGEGIVLSCGACANAADKRRVVVRLVAAGKRYLRNIVRRLPLLRTCPNIIHPRLLNPITKLQIFRLLWRGVFGGDERTSSLEAV